MNDQASTREEIRVSGDQLVSTVKRLVHEGNVRRITLKDEEGHAFLEIPLTMGVVGTMLIPIWAALGAIAALVSGFTIVVERTEPADGRAPDEHLAHAT